MKPFRMLLLVAALSLQAARAGEACGADTTLVCRAGAAGCGDAVVGSPGRWRLSGYLQTGFEWSASSSEFFLKRARISLSGTIGRAWCYRVQAELRAPRIVDAYIEWRPRPWARLRLGQYKIPFSIENTACVPCVYEFIEYPQALRRQMGFAESVGDERLQATGRDMGLTLSGGWKRRDGEEVVAYDLGLYNGEGINARDRNRRKDLAARLMLRPVRGLLVSGSYYRGAFGPAAVGRERIAAGAFYDAGGVVLRGEWIGGWTGDGAAQATRRSSGWYAMAGWHLPCNLLPALRCDGYTDDHAARRATHRRLWTAALRWQPLRHLCCQVACTYEQNAPGTPDRQSVAAMVTGMF